MIPHVNTLGWTEASVIKAAKDAQIPPEEALIFMGTSSLGYVRFLGQVLVEDIRGTATPQELKALPIVDRLTFLIMGHLHPFRAHKKAVLKALKILVHPLNVPTSIKLMSHVVDALWRQAGDQSTDFNYYTKRLLLGKIYGATVLYWLRDQSLDHEKTQGFLRLQLEGVIKLFSFKSLFKRYKTKS